ncbi:MAG: TetR/AcrR family transcriptional regulator [Acidimicrobiales bacterium]|jgi:AcrR family transcriptional regulator|nr:TetR/AcrR family transcriptional regulator [Acidimicrobiales bacterium]
MSSTTVATQRARGARPSTLTADRRLVCVDAFIDLVLESGSPPTPEDVADRAGVSRATFFRYFSTLVELRNEAAARVIERFPELFTIPAIATGSLDERIRRFVDARVRLHEALHPLELLTRSHAAHDADTAGFVDAVRQVHADQVRQHFEADLQPHGLARRDDMVAAIGVLTSVESWQQFRHSFGRSPFQTNRAWRTALAGILAVGSRIDVVEAR